MMITLIDKWVRYHRSNPDIERFELPESEWAGLRAEVAVLQEDGIPWVADIDETNFLFRGLPAVISND